MEGITDLQVAQKYPHSSYEYSCMLASYLPSLPCFCLLGTSRKAGKRCVLLIN